MRAHLASACAGGSLGRLQMALVQCTMQRMHVLHERLLRLRYSCPLPGAGATGSSRPNPVAQQAATVVASAEQSASDELTALSDAIITAAANWNPHGGDPTMDSGSSIGVGDGEQLWAWVCEGAEVLLKHASAEHQVKFLQLLLQGSIDTILSGAEPLQSEVRAGIKEDRCSAQTAGLGARGCSLVDSRNNQLEHMLSERLSELNNLDSEWVQAAASLVQQTLSMIVQPRRSPGTAQKSGPKRSTRLKGSRAELEQDATSLLKQVETALAVIEQLGHSSMQQDEDDLNQAVCSCLHAALTSSSLAADASISKKQPKQQLWQEQAHALQSIRRLFDGLECLPRHFFAARASACAGLIRLALLTEAAILATLSILASDHPCQDELLEKRNPGIGAESDSTAAVAQEAAGAFAAVHSFLAAAASARNANVQLLLARLAAEVQLSWPFAAAALAHAISKPCSPASKAEPYYYARRLPDSDLEEGEGFGAQGTAVMDSRLEGMLRASESILRSSTQHGLQRSDQKDAAMFYSVLSSHAVSLAADVTESPGIAMKPQIPLQLRAMAAAVMSSLEGSTAANTRRSRAGIVAGKRRRMSSSMHNICDDSRPPLALMHVWNSMSRFSCTCRHAFRMHAQDMCPRYGSHSGGRSAAAV